MNELILCACEESQAVTEQLRKRGGGRVQLRPAAHIWKAPRMAYTSRRIGGGEDAVGHGYSVPSMHRSSRVWR